MKKLFSAMVIGFAAMGFTAKANAGLLLEPYMSFETGKAENVDASGNGMGLRIGYSMLGLWVGGEYGTLNIKDKNDLSSQIKDLGINVGYDFPVLVRAYATYYISSTQEFSGVSYYGGGTKIGIGFTALPFVSINVETISRTYGKFKNTGGSTTDMADQKVSTTGISLSLPFDL